jgi:HK97 family phage prohead protease
VDSPASHRISGYGSVFWNGQPGTEYVLFTNSDGSPALVERILDTAFDRVIAERQDVLALFNHNPDIILGRVSAGTLILSVDRIGLRYEIDPNPVLAPAVVAGIARGDIVGSSFTFLVAPNGQRFVPGMNPGDPDLRIISEFSHVGDTGPVCSPAYLATTADVDRNQLDDFEEDDDEEDEYGMMPLRQAWRDACHRNVRGNPLPRGDRDREVQFMRDRLAIAEAE